MNSPYISPRRLAAGDEVCVVAPSRSLGGLLRLDAIDGSSLAAARSTLGELGLSVRLGAHLRTCDEALSSPVRERVADLHSAYQDDSISGIVSLCGGSNAIQLLRRLDFDHVRASPKVFVGYSDAGTVINAIATRSQVIGYYGPNLAGLAVPFGREYAIAGLRRCLFQSEPFEIEPSEEWSDDGKEIHVNTGPFVVQEGDAEGRTVGGGFGCLSILQGTKYFPSLSGSVLLLESPSTHRKATLAMVDAALDSLIYQSGFKGVRAIGFGRFRSQAQVTRDGLRRVIRAKPELRGLPIVAGLDFGHTLPRATLPIGGRVAIHARRDDNVLIRVTCH